MGVQVPLWMFALALAALAPFLARAFAQAATRRVEARTRELVARARQVETYVAVTPFSREK